VPDEVLLTGFDPELLEEFVQVLLFVWGDVKVLVFVGVWDGV
jgi:hypothetical protein